MKKVYSFFVQSFFSQISKGRAITIVFLLFIGANLQAQYTEQAKILAQLGAAGDQFGYSVAISGTTALVGAFGVDDNGSSSGSAYIFEKDFGGTDNWGLVKKLTASDGAAGDLFGHSVAISGTTALVGAYLDDDNGSNSGSAYIFEKDFGGTANWGELTKLTASDGAISDLFGNSVAISGTTALVGAHLDDDNGIDSGSAYIFEKDFGGTANWGELTKLTASDGATGDQFGFSVAISGTTALVGARLDDDNGSNSGSAYIFEKDFGGTANWGELTKLTASDGATGDQFGFSVAISGTTALVGAYLDDDNGSNSGSAYIFEKDFGGTANWGQLTKLLPSDGAADDRFGLSVAISGTTALVGAPFDDDNGSSSGSAYIFEKDFGGTANWGELTKLTASDGAAFDQFGYSVAISGTTALVGAYLDDDNGFSSGSAYVFQVVICPDADLDGVCDEFDLDDDNDGILDINECNFPTAVQIGFELDPTPFAPNSFVSDFNFAGTDVDYIISTPDFVANIVPPSNYNTPEGSFFGVLQARFSPTLDLANNGLGFGITAAELTTLGANSGDDVIFSFRYAPGINANGSRQSDADTEIAVWFGNGPGTGNYDTFNIVLGGTTPLPSTPDALVIPGQYNGLNNNGSLPMDPSDWQVYHQSFNWTGGDVYIALQALSGAVYTGGNINETVFVDDIQLVFGSACDNTDGDALVNSLDLDSDADGCNDVLEAGHADPDLDGILGTSPVTVDADGLVVGEGGYTGTTAATTDDTVTNGCCIVTSLSLTSLIDETCPGAEDGEVQVSISFLGSPVAINGTLVTPGGPFGPFPLPFGSGPGDIPPSGPVLVDIENLPAGNYSLIVEEHLDPACSITLPFTIGTQPPPVDADGDGFTVCDGDCDDGDGAVFPGATEVCDGIDNDCDGEIDEEGGPLWYVDADGDGFGDAGDPGTPSCFTIPGSVTNNTDCNDADSAVNPAASEICNGQDDDCDTAIDEAFDLDGDGFTTCGADGIPGTGDEDCNDADATISPGATEILCDGIDNDCNPLTPDNSNPATVNISTQPGIGVVTQLIDGVDYIDGTDFDLTELGPGVSETGGQTWQLENMDATLCGGLWWSFFQLENPRHETQGFTGFMEFQNYDPLTGIALWNSTAPMVIPLAVSGGPVVVNTQFRMQLQPLGAGGIDPLPFVSLGTIPTNTVFANDIGLGSLDAGWPLLDVKAYGDFQAWFRFEVAGTAQPLAPFYNGLSTISGQDFITSASANFYKAAAECDAPAMQVTLEALELLPDIPAPFQYTFNGITNSTGVFPSMPPGTFPWEVLDGNGCLTQGTTTIDTAVDITPPVITCPADVTIDNDPGQCSAQVNYPAPTVTDNCVATILWTDIFTQFAAPTPTQGVTWDNFRAQLLGTYSYSKMTISGTFDVTGQVVTDPAIILAFANALRTGTDYISPLTNGNTWSYCASRDELWLNPPTLCDGQNCPAPGYIIRPNQGNSNFGGVNTSTCGSPSQTMNLEFEIGPQPIIVCTPASGNVFNVGSTTVTCTATDAGGNTASCTFDVTVNDTEQPVITCPADITVGTGTTLLANYPLITDINDAAGNFGPMQLLGPPDPTPPSLGSPLCHDGTYIFPVPNIQTPNLAGLDATNFILRVDFNLTGYGTAPGAPVIMGSLFNRWIGVYVDPTGLAGIKYNNTNYDFSTTTLNLGQWYTAEIRFSAGTAELYIDGNPVLTTVTGPLATGGNFTFTVLDGQAQRALNGCLRNLQVFNQTGVACAADVSFLATATDNCPGVSVACDAVSGSTFGQGGTTVNCTATDASSNTAACSFNITVEDITPPVVLCPPDVTIEWGDPEDPGATGNPTVTDNCDPNPVITFTDNVILTGSCPVARIITRTFTATDADGNASTCLQIISVTDLTGPVVTCPPDFTVEWGENIEPGAPGPCIAGPCVAPDNGIGTIDMPAQCPYNGQMVISNGLPPGSTIEIDASLVNFFNVTVNPGGLLGGESVLFEAELEMPMTGTGLLAGFNRFIIMPVQGQMDLGPRTPGDAVQTFPAEMIFLQGQIFGDPDFDILVVEAGLAFGLPSPGQTTLTELPGGDFNVDSFFDIAYRIDFQGAPGSILDGLGGSSQSQSPFIQGAPCTPGGGIPSPTITDNCDPNPTVTFNDVFTSTGACPIAGFVTRTWTAIDVCGNVGTCVQIISLTDTSPPTFTAPGNTTLEWPDNFNLLPVPPGLPQDPRVDPSCLSVDDQFGPAVPNWFVDLPAGQDVMQSSGEVSINLGGLLDCTLPGGQELQMSGPVLVNRDAAQDLALPTAPCPSVLNGNNDVIPTEIVSMELSGGPGFTLRVGAGNGIGPGAPLPASTGHIVGQIPAQPTLACSYFEIFFELEVPFPPFFLYNQDALVVLDTIDRVPPQAIYVHLFPPGFCVGLFTSPAPGTGTLVASLVEAAHKTVPIPVEDNCDLLPEITFQDVLTGPFLGNCANGLWIVERTWTAVDNCGNVSPPQVQLISFTDFTPPVIVCPPDLTLNAGDNDQPPATGVATATDNCDPNPAITFNDVVVLLGTCPSSIERTWTATDICGNSSTCVQLITVIDNEPPVISCPTNITQSNDPGECCATVSFPDPTATDNCGLAGPGIISPWINEIHYDNAGGDVGQFIEIAGLAGTDLSLYQLIAYEAFDGLLDATATLSGIIPDEGSGYGAISFPSLGTGFYENGSSEGLALNETGVAVVEFISYEGVVTALNGPAIGLTSVDIGVSESSSTLIGESLQKIGSGSQSGNFTWTGPVAESPGTLNSGQTLILQGGSAFNQIAGLPSGTCFPLGTTTNTFVVTDLSGNSDTCSFTVTVTDNENPVITCPPDVTLECDDIGSGIATATDNCDVLEIVTEILPWINEIHYDNTGTDVGQFIEIAGLAGTDLSLYQLIAYEAFDGLLDATATLSGIIPDEGSGYGAISFPSLGFGFYENGPSDGLALNETGVGVVEFISYEGVVTALNGPAVGLTSTNIGVSESSFTPIGSSLQKIGTGDQSGDFTWTGPTAESPGLLNAGQNASFGGNITSSDLITPGSCPNQYTITRTWTATDASGNSASCDQTIEIIDTTPPTLNCPDIVVSNDPGECCAVVDFDIDIDDNCLQEQSFTQNLDPLTITQFNSVSCNAGGLHTDNSYIRVYDISSFPAANLFLESVDVGVETAAGSGGSQPVEVNIYSWDGVGALTFAAITPNLISSTLFVMPDQTQSIQNIPISGVASTSDLLVVEFFTPDGQGVGNSFFIGSNPNGQTGTAFLAAAPCGLPEPASVGDIGFPGMHFILNVNGNDGTSFTTTVNTGLPSGSCFPVGITPVQLTIADACGNESICNFSVTVNDTEPPLALCAGSACEDPITSDTGNNNSIAGAQDISGAGFNLDPNANIFNATTEPHTTINGLGDGTYDYYSFQANAGDIGTFDIDGASFDTQIHLYNSAGVNVNSNDDTFPLDPGSISGLNSLIQNHVFATTDTYIIAIAAFFSTGSPGGVTGAPVPPGGTYILHVSLNNQPVCVPGAATTVVLDEFGNGSITLGDIDAGTTDNCDLLSVTAGPLDFDCSNIGDNIVTLTATDIHGNVSTCESNVVVVDDSPAVLTCPADQTLELGFGLCLIDVTGLLATAVDNCGGLVITNDSPFANDPGADASGTYPQGVHTITFSVVDAGGNVVSCQTIVEVQDLQTPIAACTKNLNVSLTNVGCAEITFAMMDAGSTDNCTLVCQEVQVLGPLGGPHDPSLFPDNLVCCEWLGDTLEVLLTVCDQAGNYNTCIGTIKVGDFIPPDITCPPDTLVDCHTDMSSATLGVATATDNLDLCNYPLVFVESDIVTPGSCPQEWTITRTWCVTDVVGNMTCCDQIILVQDTTPPVFAEAPFALNDTIDCMDPNFQSLYDYLLMMEPSPSDLCGVMIFEIEDLGLETRTQCEEGVYQEHVRVWTATDSCGNFATYVQSIYIIDTTPPAITCPNDGDAITLSADAGACTALFDIDAYGGGVTDCPGQSVETTYTLVDLNTGDEIFFESPVPTCDYLLAATPIACGENLSSSTIGQPFYGTGFCGTSNTAPGTWFSLVGSGGPITLSTCNQAAYDTKISVFTNVGECGDLVCVGGQDDAAGCAGFTTEFTFNSTIYTTYYVMVHGFGTATGSFTLSATCTSPPPPPPASVVVLPVGEYWLTCTATDGCGNTSTCKTTVTVGDNETPFIDCSQLADITLSSDDDACGTTHTWQHPDINDSCPGTVLELNYNGDSKNQVVTPGAAAGDFFPVGTTTLHYYVTDGAGNADSCWFTVVVVDDVTPVCAPIIFPPVITCAAPVVSTDTPFPMNGLATSGTDVTTITVPVGTTYDAMRVNIDMTHTFMGDLDITLTSPGGGTVVQLWENAGPDCGASNDMNATFANGGAPAGSVCGPTVGTFAPSGGFLGGAVLPSFNAVPAAGIWTLTITDNFGGDSGDLLSWSLEFCNLDSEVVCDLPDDVVGTTSQNTIGDCIFEHNWKHPGLFDNCGVTLSTVTYSAGVPAPSTLPASGPFDPCTSVTENFTTGVTIVTYDFADAAGNSDSKTFTVTVTDDEAPVTLCQDITVYLDGAGNATITPADVDAGSTDNCDAPILTLDIDAFTCADVFAPVNVSLTATDLSGNNFTCWAEVTVLDTIHPVITCADDANDALDRGTSEDGNLTDCLYTASGGEFDALATDNCNASVTNDLNGIASVDGEDFALGVHTIVWTAVDPSGNTVNCSITFEVTDDQAPVFLYCPDNIVAPAVTGTCSNLISWLEPIESDIFENCELLSFTGPVFSDGTVMYTPQSNGLGEALFPVGTTTVCYTATDVNGLSTDCCFTVTITDDVNPSITCPPAQNQNYDINCVDAGVPDFTSANASDNCPGVVVTQSPGVGTLISSIIVNPGAGDSYIVTLTATDAGGNTADCSFAVTLVDNTGFTLFCPGDQTVGTSSGNGGCNASLPNYLGLILVANGCDTAGVTLSQFPAPNTIISGTQQVVITGDDGNGNTYSCLFNVNVVDDTPPVFTEPCPADVLVAETALNTCTAIVGLSSPAATDNCGPVTVVGVRSDGLTLLDLYPVGTTVVIWVATDGSGNTTTTTCETLVTVTDPVQPSAVCIAPGGVFSLNGLGYSIVQPWQLDGGSADNCPCGIANMWLVWADPTIINDSLTCAHVGNQTVTLFVQDCSGNVNDCTTSVLVEDKVEPEFTCVAEVTIDCQWSPNPDPGTGLPNPALGFTGVITDAWDACGIVGMAYNDVNDLTGCNGTGTIFRTWTVTDANGNITECVQTIHVTDNKAPTWVTPLGSLDVTLECGDAAGIADAETWFPAATDQCGDVGSILLDVSSENSVGVFCLQSYSIIRTFTATDACGNVSAEFIQTITIEDTTPPTFTAPNDKVLSCELWPAGLDLTGDVTNALDNCDPTPIVIWADELSGLISCNGTGTITRTWTVTDACGNSTSHDQLITITDNIAPTFDIVPNDLSVQCSVQVPVPYPNFAAFSSAGGVASDNCGLNLGSFTHVSDVSDNGTCPETITRIYSIADNCGNSASYTQIIVVNDDTPPMLLLPPALTLSCEDDLTPNGEAGQATAMDNCSTPVVGWTDAILVGNCANEWTITRTWTATDDCGNVATNQQSITVIDKTAPTFDSPADVTINCEDSTEPGNTGSPTNLSDNCDNAPGITHFDSVEPGDCPQESTIARTWVALDACGNSSSSIQMITIEDNEAPVPNCPAPLTLLTAPDFAGFCGALLLPGDFVPNPIDNCGAISMTHNVDGGPEVSGGDPEGWFDVGHYVITWTFVDECGNTSTCSSELWVEDNEPPTMVCKSSLTTVLSPINGIATHGALAFDNASFDNCPGDLSYLINGADSVTFNCDDAANSPVIATLTVIDAAGNAETCNIEVIVQDNTPPQLLSCAPPVIADNDPGQCGAFVTVGQPTVLDNCPLFTNSYNGTSDASDWYPVGVHLVVWTITDVGGNAVLNCTSIVEVKDKEPPVLSCEDVTLHLDVNGQATLVADAMSSDNCGIVSSTLSKTNFDCGDLGTVSAWLIVSDAAGNSSTCNFDVIVLDDLPPVALCQDLTLSLGGNGFTSIDSEEIDNGSSDNCGIVGLSATPLSFDCDDQGQNTVTLTVTDNEGNSSTCTATVTVEDNEPPVIDCPASISVGTLANNPGECQATVSGLIATASDNCGATIANSYNGNGANASDTYPLGNTSVTFTATDEEGNSDACTITVTVTDDELPDCNPPADVTIFTSDDGNYDCGSYAANFTATAGDNCGVVSISNNSLFADAPNADASGIYPGGVTTTVTWTVVDVNGNVSACSASITVDDDEDPMITCPPGGTFDNTTGFCGANLSAVATAIDNCDISYMEYTLSFAGGGSASGNNQGGGDQHTIDAGTFFPVGGPHVITYTAHDLFGHTATCTASYTVIDSEDPVCVTQDITVSLDSNGEVEVAPQDVDGGSTDNCGIDTLELNATMGTCANKGPNLLTLIVTDVNGNVSTCTVTVTVVDDEDPTCSAQDITIALDANGQYLLDPSEINDGSSDNCGVSLTASKASVSCIDLGVNLVTLTVTDPSGNSSDCDATVTVIDNLPPTIVCPAAVDSCNAKGLCENLVTVQLATGDDNCSYVITNDSPHAFSGLADASGVYPVGTHVVTFTATDQDNNSTSCTTTITVTDCEAPNVICIESTTATLTGVSNTVVVPASSIDNGTFDNCPGELIYLINGAPEWEFGCSDVGENTVTLTVIDPAGNQESCTATVNVQDSSAPTITCVGDIIVPVNPELCGADVLVPQPSVTGSTCGISITNDQNGTDNASGFYPIGVTTVTYTIVDGVGNITNCSFTVTVGEFPAPENLANANIGTGYNLTWDPVPGTLVCQLKGGPEGGGDFASLIIWGNPGSRFVDMSVLTAGASYQWKVRCACSTQPLQVSQFSAYNYFTVPLGPGTEGLDNPQAYEKDLNIESNLSVFPNPNTGEFTIVTDMKDYQFTIRDMAGKLILEQNGGNDGWHQIDLRSVESGVYFLQLYSNDAILTEKIVIEH